MENNMTLEEAKEYALRLYEELDEENKKEFTSSCLKRHDERGGQQ